jgi:hypothetical protein
VTERFLVDRNLRLSKKYEMPPFLGNKKVLVTIG